MLQRPEVIFDLGDGACPDNDRRDTFVAQQPCQSHLGKGLAALPGDFVDPSAFPIRSVDSHGRSISPALLPGVVPPGMALVLADHPGSFDSRYFGFVPLDSLQRVEPIFVFHPKGK